MAPIYNTKNQLQRMVFKFASTLGEYPSLYRFLYRTRRLKQELIVSDQTDLVIEGFPRCANTFVCSSISLANPNIRIAHHVHSVSQVITAVKRDIPCLVLIRSPIDAVTSLCVRHPFLKLKDGFWAYQKFYQTLLPYRSGFVVGDFQKVCSELKSVVSKLNSAFGQNYKTHEDLGMTNPEVFKLIENRISRGDERKCDEIGIPSLARKPRLEELRRFCANDKSLKHTIEKCNEAFSLIQSRKEQFHPPTSDR